MTAFQGLLVARAVGPLVSVNQPALDRIARFRFGESDGFVSAPAVTLIAELTGRNGNLILVDDDEVILGAQRDVGADINRYREVRAGLRYQPPPPYDKRDPRLAEASDIASALEGATIKDASRIYDGIGPELSATLARLAGVDLKKPLHDEDLDRVRDAFLEVVRSPTEAAGRALARPSVAELRESERREQDQRRVEAHLKDRLAVLVKRNKDAERAWSAAEEAPALREEADVLLAHAHTVPANVASVTLNGFDGHEVTLQLDPSKSVAANAEARYDQARRREARAARASEQQPEIEAERAELEAALASLPQLSDAALRERAAQLAPRRQQERRAPGVRYDAPHGFTVIVGRNARENDEVTFSVARSRDLWLHVQGWTGSHVIVQAKGREVPFDVVLFAAQLAAGFSKASGSDNVPVDYTLRKNVWKIKGGPPGAVRFTQQKTVYVTPSRNPGEA